MMMRGLRGQKLPVRGAPSRRADWEPGQHSVLQLFAHVPVTEVHPCKGWKKSNKINTVEVLGSTSTAFLLASLIQALSLQVIEWVRHVGMWVPAARCKAGIRGGWESQSQSCVHPDQCRAQGLLCLRQGWCSFSFSPCFPSSFPRSWIPEITPLFENEMLLGEAKCWGGGVCGGPAAAAPGRQWRCRGRPALAALF